VSLPPIDPTITRLRFASFELDREPEQLWRDGTPVRIQPQPCRVLWILASRSGQIVSRDELRTWIWDTATFVEFDQGLNYCIRQIRLALRDDVNEPVFIETVKRRGYRFIAPVEPVAPAQRATQPAAGADAAGIPNETAPRHASSDAAAPDRHQSWRARFGWRWIALSVTVSVAVLAALAARVPTRTMSVMPVYTPLTSFSDAAFAPAISPDGHTIAFIVGSDTGFPTFGEIYTKTLPDGEPIQRTHDAWPKYGVAFSPDGSQITYTVSEPSHGWATAVLPLLGGEPRMLLANAAGLTWIAPHRVLFGEIKSGLHMGLVTATDSRSDLKDVYLPAHERGMAHYGYASPDRQSVLVVEMGPAGGWNRCRLVPFDGHAAGTEVGPTGPCTSAAWSPDGRWMYFTALVNGDSHIWRERFPTGDLEQLTSGPAQERGIAVTQDGRSMVTSLGIDESGIWLHDGDGDHQIVSEGLAFRPSFSRDGRLLYYLLSRVRDALPELWVADLASRHSEPLVRGFALGGYDVSPDGARIVFAARSKDGEAQVWLASRDHLRAPQLLASSADSPFFAGDGTIIVFRKVGAGHNELMQVSSDGGSPTPVLRDPILNLYNVSPDGRMALGMMPISGVLSSAMVGIPLAGGTPVRICPATCMAKWSPDGGRFYVTPLLQGLARGLTIVMPVPKGRTLPDLPPAGIESADAAHVAGSTTIDLSHYDSRVGADLAPGLTLDVFAYARTVSHRNLSMVRLR
jgi:DNA-binding winged helix-turn-helix (wHTH) protein/Tol biopolymer transport system component